MSTNYEFHVGDYVETVDGQVGYITSISGDMLQRIKFYWTNDNDPFKYLEEWEHDCYLNFYIYFKRIGKYNFTSPIEKSKIKPISPSELMNYPCDTITDVILYQKINEIIAYINKE